MNKYSWILRERIIDRWEQLEIQSQNGTFQIPQSFSEALMLAAKQVQQIEEQQKQIKAKDEQILLPQNNLTSGRRVRLAGSTETGIIIAKSKYVNSVLVRWTGGDVAWEEYYRLELA